MSDKRIVFEDPGTLSERGDYAPIRAACRANPGKWAILKKNANPGSAGFIVNARMNPRSVWFCFEATMRGNANLRTIYVRFVPPPEQS